LAGGALLVALVFLGRLADLQLRRGQTFALQAENNTLRHSPIFPDRGTLTDRLGEALAWELHSANVSPFIDFFSLHWELVTHYPNVPI
jgi:cell division protein FtsI/penicillin-binding protein 2